MDDRGVLLCTRRGSRRSAKQVGYEWGRVPFGFRGWYWLVHQWGLGVVGYGAEGGSLWVKKARMQGWGCKCAHDRWGTIRYWGSNPMTAVGPGVARGYCLYTTFKASSRTCPGCQVPGVSHSQS
eukprot:755696-Hanusia_phi.AAC.7